MGRSGRPSICAPCSRACWRITCGSTRRRWQAWCFPAAVWPSRCRGSSRAM